MWKILRKYALMFWKSEICWYNCYQIWRNLFDSFWIHSALRAACSFSTCFNATPRCTLCKMCITHTIHSTGFHTINHIQHGNLPLKSSLWNVFLQFWQQFTDCVIFLFCFYTSSNKWKRTFCCYANAWILIDTKRFVFSFSLSKCVRFVYLFVCMFR